MVLVTGYAELPGGGDLRLPRLSKPYRLQELEEVISTLGAGYRKSAYAL